MYLEHFGFSMDGANLLSLVLIGQPELQERFKRETFEALRQRIGIRYHLTPIGREETGKYIVHRSRTAQGDQGSLPRRQ